MDEKKTDKRTKISETIKRALQIITNYLQYILAAVIIIGILIQLMSLPGELGKLIDSHSEGFKTFLKYMIDMVIGIELIKLLSHPNLDNVVEILLIAITREIVLTTPAPLGILLGVGSIALLFAVRKFLFVDKLDNHDQDFIRRDKKRGEEREKKDKDH